MRSAEFERRLEDARAFGHACSGLADISPELSARGGLAPGQFLGGLAAAGAIVGFGVARPEALSFTFFAILTGTFGLIILLRLAATMAALFPSSRAPAEARKDDLPLLTILVALYREEGVVGDLLEHLRKLDYPADRLDVKLLIEADDERTLTALQAAAPPASYEIVPVPPGQPRTKPKALNYGLAFARGDVVAVFDAEDRPSPGQLREAVAAFEAGGPDLAVVQAPLLIHNRSEGWLAGQFEVEYAIHFRIWLPFLARLGCPLALGGTSNYFRRNKLVAVGGWDAWNVTEDADLGLRIARFGGKAAMISAPTWEEAPPRFGDWLTQRTRWMKGHLQTWLVLMRLPFAAANGMGWLRFASVQLTLGGSLLASMMHAPMIAWLLLGLFTPIVQLEGWHAALFGLGYGSVLAAALASKAPRPTLATVLLLPLYWPLLSIAMIQALWELRRRPHYWAKTPHGAAARGRKPA